jgi:sialic acid synthase SpsE
MVYMAEDVNKGEELTTASIRVIRPGDGLLPKYYDILVGRKFSCDVRDGTLMSWEYMA